MGSINYGVMKARPAERMRGLIGNLLFENAAEIALHGGTIALTVASFLKINACKTVIAKLKTTQTGSQTVKINSGQTITITAGSLFGSYSNAVAFNADDIQVNDYSKFSYVKFFNVVLTAAELAAYSAGNIWNYDKDCVLWMDGKMRNYDPTNSRHLDASGKGNHLTIDSTFNKNGLTKGYTNATGAGTLYNAALSSTITAANSVNQTLVWYGNIRDTGYAPIMANSNYAIGITNSQTVYNRSFKPDKSYTNRISTNKVRLRQNNFIASMKTSNVLSLYINGLMTAFTATDTGYERAITKFGAGFGLDTLVDLADLTTNTDCDLICCAMYSVPLNQLQLNDLYLRMTQDMEV